MGHHSEYELINNQVTLCVCVSPEGYFVCVCVCVYLHCHSECIYTHTHTLVHLSDNYFKRNVWNRIC